jgi:hypothetical protein
MSNQKWNMSDQGGGAQISLQLTFAEYHDKVPALHHNRCTPLRGPSPPSPSTVSKLYMGRRCDLRVNNGSADIVLCSDGIQRVHETSMPCSEVVCCGTLGTPHLDWSVSV